MAGRLLTYIREYYGGDLDPAAGLAVFPRADAQSTSITSTSGVLRLSYFTAPHAFSASRMRTYSGGTAAGATPTLARVGLYTIDEDGAGALVASIANNTALWATMNTGYTSDLSSPYSIVEGQRYAVGFLVVTAQTAPTYLGSTVSALLTVSAPRLAGSISAQTDLPASFSDASVSAVPTRPYAEFLAAA